MKRSAWLVVSLALGACLDPIVGGECKSGYGACDGQCVNLDIDFRHCGACDVSCSSDEICSAGACVHYDAGPSGDGAGMDAGTDAGTDAAAGPDASDPDASAPPRVHTALPSSPGCPDASLCCPAGTAECGTVCANLNSSLAHCGVCGSACAAGEVCAAGTCAASCPSSLTGCGDLCVDTSTSARHCGSCGNVCANAICAAGICSDALPGHLVVIGHDYVGDTPTDVQKNLAGDSLFLARGAMLTVLRWRPDAWPSGGEGKDGIERAFEFAAAQTGRGFAITEVGDDEGEIPSALITFELPNFDVFVIYPQVATSRSDLDKDALALSQALYDFAVSGRVVLLFDSIAGSGLTYNADYTGTFHLLQAANLFDAVRVANINGQRLDVERRDDAIALGASAQYVSVENTLQFEGVTSLDGVVVVSQDAAPVVIHRVFAP